MDLHCVGGLAGTISDQPTAPLSDCLCSCGVDSIRPPPQKKGRLGSSLICNGTNFSLLNPPVNPAPLLIQSHNSCIGTIQFDLS